MLETDNRPAAKAKAKAETSNSTAAAGNVFTGWCSRGFNHHTVYEYKRSSQNKEGKAEARFGVK